MSCRNRHVVNDDDADLWKEGGVVRDSGKEMAEIIDTADREEVSAALLAAYAVICLQ